MSRISIKLRITLWYMALMAGLVMVFLLIIFYISENIIHSYEYRHLENTVHNSLKEIRYENGDLVIDNDLETKVDAIQISVYNNKLEFIYGNMPLNFDFDDTFPENGVVRTVRNGNEKWYLYESRKNFQGYGDVWIRGVMTSVGAGRALETVILISLIGFPFILLFAGISGYIITGNAFRPISKIRAAAEKINAGNDLSQRINLGKGTDEIYTLAETFDIMFDRLQESFENETQFTSDVSHELRTPISVIMSQAEFGKDDIQTVEEGKKIFSVIFSESRKMSSLVSQLLTMARMDKGQEKLELENSNISEIAEKIVHSQKANASRKNINILDDIVPDVCALVDSSMITRVFINLITNAITYGRNGGNVLVRVYKRKGDVIIKVADDGTGIGKKDLDKIWTRFYQVNPARNTTNTGLGLPMVKRIVEAHKGIIFVRSRLGKGSVFTVKLPENMKDAL